MLKQYMKQAWYMIKANPLVSIISITGTALSIAMMMVVVMIWQIQLAGYAPEYHRDRMLYINGIRAVSDQGMNGSRFSSEAIKEVVYPLRVPEAVTAYTQQGRPVSLPGRRLYKNYSIKYTDPGFWRVFEFRFKEGVPFSEADFNSAISRAVITDRLAKELFGSENVMGETILIDYDAYTISGVVKEVSRAASDAHADVWVPYTTQADIMELRQSEGITGLLNVAILAKDKKDFPVIKKEMKATTDRYNDSKTSYRLTYDEEPLNRFDKAVGSTSFRKKSLSEVFLQVFGLLLFLLIVPAMNLTGVNQAAFQQRRNEIGLRKSFGATFHVLVWQILTENLLTTLIGGATGFILSFVFLIAGKHFLLLNDPVLNGEMLFQPTVFILAILFILLLNMLSALIPAWKTTSQPIVEALKNEN